MQNKAVNKPQKPADDDCCGGGSCCPCVWDTYHTELALWRSAIKEQENLK